MAHDGADVSTPMRLDRQSHFACCAATRWQAATAALFRFGRQGWMPHGASRAMIFRVRKAGLQDMRKPDAIATTAPRGGFASRSLKVGSPDKLSLCNKGARRRCAPAMRSAASQSEVRGPGKPRRSRSSRVVITIY